MRVRFFANLRNLTGCAEADIPYQETAGALAQSLCELYGDKLRQKFFPPDSGGVKSTEAEKISHEIIFLINGRHANHMGGFTALLNPDDRVDIFPALGGG